MTTRTQNSVPDPRRTEPPNSTEPPQRTAADSVPPVPRLTRQAAAALAADLAELPYTTEAVEELLGRMAVAALDREHAEPARAVLAGQAGPVPERLRARAAVVGAFMLGDPVDAQDLAAALPRLGLDGARQAGLIVDARDIADPEHDDAGHRPAVRATVDLSPYETDEPGRLWVASDQTALQLRRPLPAEHVLGVGRASLTLAGAVQRRPVDTALDLGTGCGIQTLHLLAHARHVTATDLAQRCLDFTLFNLLLNAEVLGIDREHPEERVELLTGDMLEPVEGRRFDMVVSNPPFVITPRTDPDAPVMVYRDGGREGDRLVAELIRDLPAHLTPGGTAHLLANWEIPAAQPAEAAQGDDAAHTAAWDTRPRQWVAEQPRQTQAWFVQRDVQDAAGYAETWLQDSSLKLDPDAYHRAYTSYLADFSARGVGAVGFGHVWLRRPAEDGTQGGAWTRAEELTQPIDDAIGPAWAAAVARRDRLADGAGGAVVAGGGGDPALAVLRSLHLQVPADVTEERHQRFGAAHPEVILARQGAGFRRTARLDTATAGVLSASDGELSVGQLVAAVSALLELDDAGRIGLLAAIRELYEDGFIMES